MSDMGCKLKELRTGRGMTQEALAGRLFVTRQTVSNWENGRSRPDYEQLTALAALFDVEPGALLSGGERAPWSRRKKWRGLLLGAVTAVFLVLELTLKPYLQARRLITFDPRQWLLYYLLVRTVGVLAATGFALHLLSWKVDLPVFGGAVRRGLLLAASAMVLFVVAVPPLFYFAPWLPMAASVLHFCMDRTVDNFYFIVAGILFFFALHRKAEPRGGTGSFHSAGTTFI